MVKGNRLTRIATAARVLFCFATTRLTRWISCGDIENRTGWFADTLGAPGAILAG